MSQPATLADYQRSHPFPFPMFCDPERAVYRRFGLARASLASFFRPSVLAGYWRLVRRGWKPRRHQRGEDPFQLGGDFILAENQEVIFAYSSKEATDRPALRTLLQALAQPKS
jgi:hypothetical protein